MSMRDDKWTNSTTRSTGGTETPFVANSQTIWFGARDDGTTAYLEFSFDGVNFITAISETKSTGFLGSSGYSNIFFGMINQTTKTAYCAFRAYNANALSGSFI
jgi:hypothetical protein